MTLPNRFPEPSLIWPSNLIKSVSALPDYDSTVPFAVPDDYWEAIKAKIMSGKTLSDHEKTIFVNNSDRFDPQTIQRFCPLFRRDLTLGLLKRASVHLNRTLFPRQALLILLDPSLVSHFGKEHLTKGIQDHADQLLVTVDHSLWEPVLKTSNNPAVLIQNFANGGSGFTAGQCEILRVWLQSDARTRLFRECYTELWSWVAAIEEGHADQLKCLNSIVSDQMALQPNWNATLLDKTSHFGQLVQDLLKFTNSQQVSLTRYRSLDLVLKEYLSLVDALKELSQLVPQRGEFWGAHLSKCSSVQTRKFKVGAKVAVAMTFGTTTIVEFGPVGHAALIYDSKDFANHISDRTSWRNMELAKRASTFTDGRILHMEGWMRKVSDLLRYLLSGGK